MKKIKKKNIMEFKTLKKNTQLKLKDSRINCLLIYN